MTTFINADNGVVSGVAGLKYSADSSGLLALQTNTTTALTIDTTQGVTFATGLLANNPFAGSYTSGIVLDHTTNLGRITVGSSAAIAFYNGGISARVETARFSAAGIFTTVNDALIHGVTVGLGGGSVNSNTAVGGPSLGSNTTGINNTAIGLYALANNTTGSYNTSVGRNSLSSTVGGVYNSAFGYNTLASNVSGNNSSAFGMEAAKNATGSPITAVGSYSAYNVTTGIQNVAMGYNSLYNTNTGSYNVAIGDQALSSNTTASNNVAVGFQAGYQSTYGNNNALFGHQAAYNLNPGSLTDTNTTAIGYRALYSVTTGSNNVAVGFQAGYSNTTGVLNTMLGYLAGYTGNGSGHSYNTYIGVQAGYNVTSGGGNTFVGYGAGAQVTTGAANVFVGPTNNYNAGSAITTGSNNVVIGGYSGNNDGLDIRTAGRYIVLADGVGTRQLSMYKGGTVALDTAVPQAGTGITFPATQSASSDANTLDDYEEGTYSPVVTFGGASTGITYTYQNGMYVKVGQLVHVQVLIVLSNRGSASGALGITVPFACNSGTYYSSGGFSSNQITVASGAYNLSYQMGAGAVSMDWYNQVSGGNKTGLVNTQLTNTAEIIFAFTYRAAA